ncbi:hypothetical protein HDV00_012539, partial [Rhizophlyctis rosea]
MGLLSNVDLHRSRAIVTGGAITACLLPWPHEAREAYMEEYRVRWLIERGLGLPVEIGLQIAEHCDIIQAAVQKTDSILFNWLHGEKSHFQGSDVDIFFVVDPSTCSSSDEEGISLAADRLVAMHKIICNNRTNSPPEVEKYLDNTTYPRYFGFRKWELDSPEDFFACTMTAIDKTGRDADDIWNDGDFLEDEDNVPPNAYDLDERGWSIARRNGLRGRLRFSATIRTNNSVTVTGLWPIRHTQLMLPVVRAAEEVVLPFDLDCVAVYWDGENVFASHRALRSFNTRTNFVDMTSLRDRARGVRMKKYTQRGFSTVFFETCRHHPRCDVDASVEVRDVLHRMFVDDGQNKRSEESDKESDGSDSEEGGGVEGFDYLPTSLCYGMGVGIEEVNQEISRMASDWDPWKDDEKEPRAMRLTLRDVTGNAARFKQTILSTQPGIRSLIPMQFKWIKDTWLRRRIGFGIGFERCYMCGVDVDADEKRKKQGGGDGEDGVVDGATGEKDNDEDENKDDMEIGGSDNSEDGSAKKKSRQIPLCATCTHLNAQKRAQTTNMTGLVCIVTGGRTKIGYHTALKFLRCGATVLITTRFPLLAAERYMAESDSATWKDRLKIFGIDFRRLGAVGAFCEWVKGGGVERVDVLVNNAAQTIWRPGVWYEGLLKREGELVGRRDLVGLWEREWEGRIGSGGGGPGLLVEGGDGGSSEIGKEVAKWAAGGIAESAVGTQQVHPSLPADLATPSKDLFPAPKDLHGEPVDLRPITSWTSQLTDVPLSELLETTTINTLTPTLLIQHLLPLLKAPPPSPPRTTRFIINVSSPE